MCDLTIEQYEQQVADCKGLCVVTEAMLETDPDLMKCVRCPFCTQIVNAILTDTSITCPVCKVSVKR